MPWISAATAVFSLTFALPGVLPAPAVSGTVHAPARAAPHRPGASSQQAPQSLLRFEPLVGGRWVAEGDLGGGRLYTAERRYEWFMDRRFVRVHQRLTVDGVNVDEEAVIGWDGDAAGLRMWSFASDGSYAEGRERPAQGDNRWTFEGRTIGGRGGEWRITTLLVDPASFSVLLELRNGGSFEPAMTIAYRKVADDEEGPLPRGSAPR